MALAASAGGAPEVESLILPPWLPEEEFALVASADYQERKRALTDELREPSERDRIYLRRRKALSASR